MTDNTVLQTRLEEAEAALHDLSLGDKAVTVSVSGKSVTFTPANIGGLRAYISELQSKLGIKRRSARRVMF
ncbi:MAG: phage tail protein [Desulfobacterales bacterium]|nr:phage tail protein [Desulfobacterales bacterium]